MAEEFNVEKKANQPNEKGVIDEANYNIHAPQSSGPAAIGKGGDPLFRTIRASKDKLETLLDETTILQNWVQRETCNNVALACLNNENLKDIYFEIKDGFDEYGPIMLMGFKTPQGVEIPRLKILDKDGEVLEVLTGPMAIDEINKRALAYQESKNGYEPLNFDCDVQETAEVIADYSGNPDDYT
jgi:hypothetical protein